MKRIFLYVIILLLAAVTLESKASAVEFVIPASTNGAFADLLAGTKLLRENGVTLYESTANILELRFKMIKTVNGERRSFCTKKGDRFLFNSNDIFFESNGMILMTYAIKSKEAVFEANPETFTFRTTKPILSLVQPVQKKLLTTTPTRTTIARPSVTTASVNPIGLTTPVPIETLFSDTFDFDGLPDSFSLVNFYEVFGRRKRNKIWNAC
jgi:hypothetical protein